MKKLIAESLRSMAQMITALMQYHAEKDNTYIKLKNAVDAIGKGLWVPAHTFLTGANVPQKAAWFEKIPAFSDLQKRYDEALKLVEAKNPSAAGIISGIMESLKKNETAISERMNARMS